MKTTNKKTKQKKLWLTPVGKLKKGKNIKTLYDIGERLPGGIPVLYVRKNKQ